MGLLKAEIYPRDGCLHRGKKSWFYPGRGRFAFSDGTCVIEVTTRALLKALKDLEDEAAQEWRKHK